MPPTDLAAATWTWWLLRLGVSAQALSTFLQPIFAGRFLAGDFSMLAVHRTGGSVTGVVTLLQLVTTMLAWRLGRAPVQLVFAAVLFGVEIAVQLYVGFAHLLGLHLPLGVAIVGCNGWLLAWVWRHGPGLTRPVARSGR